MIKIENNEVFTTEPETKKLHRIGEDMYFARCILFPNESVENFEEVDIEDIPQPNTEEEL